MSVFGPKSRLFSKKGVVLLLFVDFLADFFFGFFGREKQRKGLVPLFFFPLSSFPLLFLFF